MKHLYFLSFAALLFTACGGNEPTSETQTPADTTSTAASADTVVETPTAQAPVVEPNAELMAIMPKFIAEDALPFNPGEWEDEYDIFEEMDALNSDEVRLLTTNMLKHKLNEQCLWDLNHFYMIDSLQTNELYDDYVANIDIGMIQEAGAKALWKYSLANGNEILTWTVNYSTYEACPYAAGDLVFATVVKDGNVASCTLLNEKMSAGDPPVGMSRNLRGLLNADGLITLNLTEEDTDWDPDKDEEVTTTSEDSFKMQVAEDGSITALEE